MSHPWQQQPGPGRPRYPPIITSQDASYDERPSPSRYAQSPVSQPRRSPMSPPSMRSPISPDRQQWPLPRPPPQHHEPQPPQQYYNYGAQRPQYQPHPNMHPAQRVGPPRPPRSPDGHMPVGPPSTGIPRSMSNQHMRQGPVPVRPGHDNLQPPRQRAAPPNGENTRQSRTSQYTASVYSNSSTPKASPDLSQMPTFGDMQASLKRNDQNKSRPSKGRASSYYGDNPFMDRIPEENISPRSRSESESSSGLEGYRTDESGVISPLDSEPKGLDGILAASNPNNSQEHGLVRQASLGKRQKAALTNVRYSEHRSIAPSVRGEEPEDHSFSSDDTRSLARSSGTLGVGMMPPPLTTHQGSRAPQDASQQIPSLDIPPPLPQQPPGSWPLRTPISPSDGRSPISPPSHTRSPVDNRSPPQMISPIDTKATTHRLAPLSLPQSRFSREYRPQQHNPNQKSTDEAALLPRRQRSLKDRVGDKAPVSIDVNAVREAEARGSMTSLPGLLNRALQMASNLERGKTSSKQSDWFGNELLKDLREHGKSTTSLNTMMLNYNGKSFPFPSTTNLPGSRGSNMSEKWPRPAPLPPSHLRNQSYNRNDAGTPYRSKYDHRGGRPQRRCCGLPLWLFFVLLFTTLILVILAVVLPVALVVIPNDRSKAPPPAPPATCATTHPCANSGTAVPDQSGACQCICANSFTGPTCDVKNNPGSCAAIPAAGLSDASVGSSLPSLIINAPAQFRVPLNATSILTAFAAANIDCDIQNTLVAVAPDSRKRGLTIDTMEHARAHKRQDAAITAGGLVIAGPTSASSAPSSSSTSDSGSVSSSTQQYTDTNHINFAKTSILYVLQVSQRLDFAVQASQKLQPFFNGVGGGVAGQGSTMGGDGSAQDPKDVDMGNGFSLDLVSMKVSGDGQIAGAGTSPGRSRR